MLRDRCPKLVSLALKYCKVKEAWLDHVYKNFIWLYVSNEERLAATRRILGYHDNKPREFKFEDTILWDNLTPKERKKWKNVQSRVSWFQRVVPYIENEYEISKKSGADIVDIKYGIMLNWLYEMCPTKEDNDKTREKKNKEINNLVDLLINYFEEV